MDLSTRLELLAVLEKATHDIIEKKINIGPEDEVKRTLYNAMDRLCDELYRCEHGEDDEECYIRMMRRELKADLSEPPKSPEQSCPLPLNLEVETKRKDGLVFSAVKKSRIIQPISQDHDLLERICARIRGERPTSQVLFENEMDLLQEDIERTMGKPLGDKSHES